MSVTLKQWQEINGCILKDMPPKLRDEYRNFRAYMNCTNRRTNFILKGKKMSNVYQVVAIQVLEDETFDNGTNTKILVPVTTVVAKSESSAIQNCLLENAEELKGKTGVEVLARPFWRISFMPARSANLSMACGKVRFSRI